MKTVATTIQGCDWREKRLQGGKKDYPCESGRILREKVNLDIRVNRFSTEQ